MKHSNKKSKVQIEGIPLRQVLQIIRRKTVQKNHGSNKQYTRKNKHKSSDYDY